MAVIERATGRRYELVKVFGPAGRWLEAATGRRYTLIKRFV